MNLLIKILEPHKITVRWKAQKAQKQVTAVEKILSLKSIINLIATVPLFQLRPFKPATALKKVKALISPFYMFVSIVKPCSIADTTVKPSTRIIPNIHKNKQPDDKKEKAKSNLPVNVATSSRGKLAHLMNHIFTIYIFIYTLIN